MRARRGAHAGRIAVAAALIVLGLTHAAFAQTAREATASTRARPDFEPSGLELGTLLSPLLGGYVPEILNAFVVSTGFEVVQEFNDNIFNRADRSEADKIVHFKPSLSVSSDFDNHQVQGFFDADRGRYYEKRAENYLDWNIGAKTRLDVYDQSQITGNYTYSRRHEVGNAPLDVPSTASGKTAFGQQISETAIGTTLFDQHFFEIGGAASTDPILARVQAAARRSAYRPKEGVSNEDRNLWEMVITPRIGYETFEDTVLFLEPRFSERFYDAKFDRLGTNNNSREYQALVGVTYDFSDLTFAELGVGVVRSEFDDRRFKPATGFSFDGTVIWNATDLVTLTFRALKSNLATTDTQTKTVATNFFSLGADWEALDNLILSVLGSYALSDYLQDEPIITNGLPQRERVDHQYGMQFGIKYLFTEYLTARADYILLDRRSNFDANKLTKRRWLLGLAARL